MNEYPIASSPMDHSNLINNNWLFFTLILSLNASLLYIGEYLLMSDELYFNALADRMTFEQIKNILDHNQKWSWLNYIILPVFNLVKFLFVAACLSLGYYFSNNKWVFSRFFRVAIQAELVVVATIVLKLFWFLLVQTDYSLADLQFFYPLSLLSFFEPQTLEPYILYPLQVVNMFELVYWLVLAYGISQLLDIKMPKAIGLVAASYGSGLLVWVAFIMFLTVSLS